VHLEEQASGPLRWHPLAAHIKGAQVEGGRLVEVRALKLTFALGDEEDMSAHRRLWVAGAEQVQAAVTLRSSGGSSPSSRPSSPGPSSTSTCPRN
jgi:hypothetical protein